MNRNYLIGFGVTAVVLGLLALVFSQLFKIVPDTKYVTPSREARVNEYLALDRWLRGMGIPVRVERSGDLSVLSQAEEKRIFIQASLFEWTDEAAECLVSWIEDGGQLFLALDFYYTHEDDSSLLSLLEEFGITIKRVLTQTRYDSESPAYGTIFAFELVPVPDGDTLCLKVRNDIIRLVQLKRGKGSFTVTGRPNFLSSWNISDEPNARLAWALFAEEAEKGGWFFIRGTARTDGFLGSLFSNGNLMVLLVSGLVLLIIAFWTVIPMFGLVRGEEETPGKPLRERFLAEGRFLKRYGALDNYCRIYVNEIRRRLARREGLLSDEDIIKRAEEVWGTQNDLLARALRNEKIKFGEFPKTVNMLKSILEML